MGSAQVNVPGFRREEFRGPRLDGSLDVSSEFRQASQAGQGSARISSDTRSILDAIDRLTSGIDIEPTGARRFFRMAGDVSRPLIALALFALSIATFLAGRRFFQLEKVRDDMQHTNALLDEAKSEMHVLEGKLAVADRAHSRAVARLKAGCPLVTVPEGE